MHHVKSITPSMGLQKPTPRACRQLGHVPVQQLQRHRLVVCKAASSSSSSSSPEFLPLGDGDAIRLPYERPDAGPRFEYSRDEAIRIQLQALQHNDKPYFDHGIEVLYRYANFDPFQRSRYFGKSFDLGQFERFRRIMHIPAYKPLLNHEEVQTLSTLQLSERVWRTRLHVVGTYRKDEGVYEITMVQRLGGRYDEHAHLPVVSLTSNGIMQAALYSSVHASGSMALVVLTSTSCKDFMHACTGVAQNPCKHHVEQQHQHVASGSSQPQQRHLGCFPIELFAPQLPSSLGVSLKAAVSN